MSETKAALQADIKVAMKARDQAKLTTLRGLSAAIKQVEIDTREEVDEGKVLQILQKEIKMRKEALEFAESQKRLDLSEKNKEEIRILEAYLGEQLSKEKLEELVSQMISEGKNNIGAIMGALNAEYKGQFDGKQASALIKEKLG